MSATFSLPEAAAGAHHEIVFHILKGLIVFKDKCPDEFDYRSAPGSVLILSYKCTHAVFRQLNLETTGLL